MSIQDTTRNIPNDLRHINFNDMVHRETLDFDHDFRCATTSSTQNLFLCLSCGKAFSGGSDTSPIIKHFFDEMHSLSLRLHDNELVLLPNYVVIPRLKELDDVLFTARPHYDQSTLEKLHEKMKVGPVFPGAFELNSIVKSNSRISVIRFISCIDPLRDYLLLNDFKTPVASAFSEFFKKFFNPFFFKKQISPDKLIHDLPNTENPFEYLSFILNSLSKEFGKKNVLEKSVRGSLIFNTFNNETKKWDAAKKNAWIVPLEMHDSPLYRSGLEKEKIIPTTNLLELLKRYDGNTITDVPIGKGRVQSQKMHLGGAPTYLLMNSNRIKKSEFDYEKNTMHIILPTQPLDLTPYGAPAKYMLRAILAHLGTVEEGEYLTYMLNKDSKSWLKCTPDNITDTIIDVAVLSQCCFILFERCDSA